MADKRKETLNFSQLPPLPHSRWLAGFLEAGASMRLTIVRNHQNGHETPQVRPEFSYGDTNPQKISHLRSLIGTATTSRRSRFTQYAIVRGENAALIAHSIKSDAPSRKTIVTAFLEWAKATTTEERLLIAKQVAGRRVVDPTDIHAYDQLRTDPEFVSGVIDSRGRLIYAEQPDKKKLSYWLAHQLKVDSINGTLLHALQRTHGGHVVHVGTQGETIIIRDKKTTLQHDVFEWILGSDQTKRLLSWANPKLPLSNNAK